MFAYIFGDMEIRKWASVAYLGVIQKGKQNQQGEWEGKGRKSKRGINEQVATMGSWGSFPPWPLRVYIELPSLLSPLRLRNPQLLCIISWELLPGVLTSWNFLPASSVIWHTSLPKKYPRQSVTSAGHWKPACVPRGI